MSIEHINIHLFYLINSMATQSPVLDQIAIFLTDALIPAFVIFLIITLWFKNETYRWQFIKTLVVVAIALLITQLIHILYYYPRPFVLGLGHLLVKPESSSSFPSQHTLWMTCITFSYFVAGFRKIGLVGVILSIIMAWTRIYVGVHFPIDVLGSFIIGFGLAFSINFFIENKFMAK